MNFLAPNKSFLLGPLPFSGCFRASPEEAPFAVLPFTSQRHSLSPRFTSHLSFLLLFSLSGSALHRFLLSTLPASTSPISTFLSGLDSFFHFPSIPHRLPISLLSYSFCPSSLLITSLPCPFLSTVLCYCLTFFFFNLSSLLLLLTSL